MDMNNVNIEEIVKQVLSGMTGNAPAAQAAPAATAAPTADPVIPKTAHVAMLTALEHYEIKEFPMPEVGDDDILVKVEGCGICGTDAHEFKRDPFGLIPVALGHEGTGEIVKMGKNVKVDTAGKPVKVGDKVVTCMIFKDDPEITMFDLNKKNVGGADVYGLLPDDDVHLNGWFSDYILIRGGSFGSTFFNVSDLDLDSRILIEPCAVLIHAVERAKTTGILRFNSRVVVQGCGPIGLICIAILRTMGIENICAVDGNAKRLAFAKKMGADVYGLLPDDDVKFNGWFADYIFIRGGKFGSTFFNVSDLDLDSRILIEPCAVLVHAVERAKTTGILKFNSRVVVQGCGPIGLICIAVLHTMGVQNICAVDGNAKRLEFAKKMGANTTVDFTQFQGIEALTEGVKAAQDGHLADFAFQCTGNPHAHANIYKFIRNGGGLCELGFFINGGDATINPHFDLCSKEINLVGSWVYNLRDYATTFDFLKRAKAIGLPMSDLITHKFPLEQINEALETNLAMTGLKIAVVNK